MSIKKSMSELERLTQEEFKRTDKLPIVVVLDEVRSMHNVGSVFRTSDAFLVQAIYLCGFTPQPPHRDIQKTALGSTETVAWKHVEDTKTAVLQLKQEGFAVYAIEQVHGSIPLHEFVLKPSVPHAFVFGNEVNGVADEVVELCDGVLEIPQLGSKHSLNISVSAGIVLWEMAKKFLA